MEYTGVRKGSDESLSMPIPDYITNRNCKFDSCPLHQMYKTTKQIHERYGNVIEITRDDSGEYETPFWAVNQARRLRRLLLEEGLPKVRILIDGQIMTMNQADNWANQEYRSLPKCEECAKILEGPVFNHSLSQSNLFCSKVCADKNYNFILSQMDEEEEFDL